jgi:hypothetical protein
LSNLTPTKIDAFIEMMRASSEAESDGFEVLAKRADAEQFFGELIRKGVLVPEKNPTPVMGKKEGHVHIPYWSALDYLGTIVRLTSSRKEFAIKLVELMVHFTRAARENAALRDNFHTWNKFAEFASEVPSDTLTDELVDLIPIWLSSSFDRGLVGGTLGMRLIPKLLQSGQHADVVRALKVLGYLTDVRWQEPEDGNGAGDPEAVVDEYWIAEALKKNLEQIARKAFDATARLLQARVGSVFGRGTRKDASWIFRAAIEDHPQNHDWKDLEDILLEAWRDSIALWFEGDADAARDYVLALLKSDSEIERRVAVHFVDNRFDLFAPSLPTIIDDRLLSIGLLHESFLFLRHHFAEFGAELQAKLLTHIEAIDAIADTEEKKRHAMRKQRSWLTAIADLGSTDANRRYREVVSVVGSPGSHPDFLSYTESSLGPGPSPYSVAELANFLMEGTLVRKLNEFHSQDRWEGPNREALCATLTSAVQGAPTEFLEKSTQFLIADPPYQYAYLSAYDKLWGGLGPSSHDQLNWEFAWPRLLDWMLAVIEDEKFWGENNGDDGPSTPSRSWIPGLVAAFVRAGMRSDEKAFELALLPKAMAIVDNLLKHLDTRTKIDGGDAVSHAINSNRGKAIEALFSLALRWARNEDRAHRDRAAIWDSDLKPRFDREVDKLRIGNIEFVTLFAQFLPQIQYLSRKWAEENISVIFGGGTQLAAALSGLAYARASTDLYRLLRDSGVLDKALSAQGITREARARLLERLVLACLWGEESFNGTRIERVFESKSFEDLISICSFLAGLPTKDLTTDQVEKALAFWRRATAWALALKPPPEVLLSNLVRFVRYLSEIDEADEQLVASLAAYANVNSNGWYYVSEMARLVEKSPDRVAKALLIFVESPGYIFDANGELLRAAEQIYESGNKVAGDGIANAMRRSEAFRALYNKHNP